MDFKIDLVYAFKALKTNRICSVVGIVGLGLGLACAIIIFKYVYLEYTTDRFHEKYDRIYVYFDRSSAFDRLALSGAAKTKWLLEKYPAVEDAVCLRLYKKDEDGFVIYNGQIYRGDVLAADSTFYKVFSFPMESGNLKAALSDPGNIVITESMAGKVFGKKDPLGEPLKFWGIDFRVAGIMKDLPVNSSFSFDVLVPTREAFYTLMASNFFTLKKGADISTVNTKYEPGYTGRSAVFLPLKGLYFEKGLDRGRLATLREGDSHSLVILMTVGFVILIISIFNYVNIYNVVLIKRGRELGVKKVFGGDNRTLWNGFWSENFVRVFLAVVCAVLLLFIFSGFIRQKVGIPLDFNLVFDFILLAGILVVLPVLVSFLPYLKYRNMNPSDSIRSTYAGKVSSWRGQMLLGMQYVMTTVMIIVSLYFVVQLNYMLRQDVGLKRDNIVRIKFFTEDQYMIETKTETEEYSRHARKRWADIRYIDEELRKNPALQNVCYGDTPLDFFLFPWKNQEAEVDYISCACLFADINFDLLYGLKLTEGSFFTRDLITSPSNEGRGVVLNETAKKLFKINDITTARLQNESWGEFKILGVVEDFRFEHLSKAVQPLVILNQGGSENPAMMHITNGKEQEALKFLNELFKKVSSESNFSYEFFEDSLDMQYKEDQKLVKTFSIFTVIAILISSMGLFGFSVFDMQQRYKEVGIRKINGATGRQVMKLLASRFVKLVGISFIVSCPLAYAVISKYMEHFSVKAPLSWWLFALAGGLTALVVFATLFWQSYRASSENPVKALKNE